MSADQLQDVANIEQLQLQMRAAHVYLDAIPGVKDPARRRVNRMHAEEVLRRLEHVLARSDIDESTRSRLEGWRDSLRDRLAQTAE